MQLATASTDGLSFYYTAIPAAKNFTFTAKAKIDSLSFQKCSKRADFQAYLANFPNGGSRAKAQAWIDEEDLWQRCLAADTKELYKEIWGEDALAGVENTVAVHIRHIREKIEITPNEPRYLKVVFGQGYKIEKER